MTGRDQGAGGQHGGRDVSRGLRADGPDRQHNGARVTDITVIMDITIT